MDTITPNPIENMPAKAPGDVKKPEQNEEEVVPVYELKSEKGSQPENEPTREQPSSSTAASLPVDDKKEEKKVSALRKIEDTITGKKPQPVDEDETEKKTADSIWAERVRKVIKIFGKKPREEQNKAQILEEGYLEEKYDFELKDNGDK